MIQKEITLAHGAGGQESGELIELIRTYIQSDCKRWKNLDKDSATIPLSDIGNDGNLVYTTDSYTVDPVFFKGGDIGKLAVCGTTNDLAVMGAKPLGMSLAFIIEEGFQVEDFKKILQSIKDVVEKEGIEIVTGDTKVMEKGKLDKIVINTSGIGIAEKLFEEEDVLVGDKVIISRGVGEHGATLLADRFEVNTELESDAMPLVSDIQSIKEYVKRAKDPTRGGLAALLNEWKNQLKIGFEIDEKEIPTHQSVISLCNLTGIDMYSLASEGCFVAIVGKDDANACIEKLGSGKIIGEVIEEKKVTLNTDFGSRNLEMPLGRLVPRIC